MEDFRRISTTPVSRAATRRSDPFIFDPCRTSKSPQKFHLIETDECESSIGSGDCVGKPSRSLRAEFTPRQQLPETRSKNLTGDGEPKVSSQARRAGGPQKNPCLL